jgi:rare lipoprotein A (peptidoglycan hydrolase)
VVPVIDRGPFNGAARWDLTQGAAQALGMTASATVGAVPLD